jgi:hypothetical protein
MVSIRRYRDRAEEYRRIAENHPYREGFLRLAATWDVLAENMEALSRLREHRDAPATEESSTSPLSLQRKGG